MATNAEYSKVYITYTCTYLKYMLGFDFVSRTYYLNALQSNYLNGVLRWNLNYFSWGLIRMYIHYVKKKHIFILVSIWLQTYQPYSLFSTVSNTENQLPQIIKQSLEECKRLPIQFSFDFYQTIINNHYNRH